MVTDLLPLRMHHSMAVPSQTDPDASPVIETSERVIAATLFTVTAFLRIVYVFGYPIDSDEPQHLHVVWGWTQGLLPYRDFFDNHTPLFHLLFAPLLAVLGERSDILFLMRLAMIPIGVVILWSTYVIGRELFSSRVGLWAAVLTGLFPNFFIHALEFRTDVLWSALWLSALAVFIQGRPTVPRGFLGGVLLGAALSVSMKTVLLLAALSMAVLGTIVLTMKRRSQAGHFRWAFGASALVGLLTVPLALISFFALHEAWTPFFYGIVQHNILAVPGLSPWQKHPWRLFLLPAALLLLCWAAWAVARQAPNTGIGIRRAVVFLAAGLYFVAVHTVWPIFTAQDHLPFYPLFMILLTPSILAAPYFLIPRWRAVRQGRPLIGVSALVILVIVEVGYLLTAAPLRRDDRDRETALLTEVLRLTRPGETVMDLKGETIYRPRPFYYVLETITRERMRRGLIADDIPDRLIATRTRVAVTDVGGFPTRGRQFIEQHYLPVGRLRVVGQILGPSVADGMHPLTFDVLIPAAYSIVSETEEAAGVLDGRLYEGARFLDRGRHEFRPSSGTGRFALVWARAVEKGYSPFTPQGGIL
jgi:4-amino-4-deoxy-L-arabinose transferase-like glycosyltransferase